MNHEPPRKSDSIDALLARGRLGGPRREEVGERVVAAHAAPRLVRSTAVRRAAFVGLPALALAAGVALVVGTHREEPLAAKGSAAAGPALDVVCASGESASCGRGQELFFRVEDAASPGFLEAWAEPAGGGERTWYFAGTGALPVPAHAGAQILKRAVRLANDQTTGAQRVHLVLSRSALERDAVLGADAGGDVTATATVTFEVTP